MPVSTDQLATAKQIVAQLDSEQRAEFASGFGLEQPQSDRSRAAIWLVVIVSLVAVAILTIWLSYERSVDAESLSPFSELAALVVGALAGLLAPSPVSSS